MEAPFTCLVDEVLSAAECLALVQRIEALGPDAAPINAGGGRVVMNTGVRNNDRVMFDDDALARDIGRRLADRRRRALIVDDVLFHAPPTALAALPDPFGDSRRKLDGTWRLAGLNERFRGYRYTRGQRFRPHFDGSFVRSDDERSLLTVLLYLNDGCGGGETALLDFDVVVPPRRGAALLFDHKMLHEGREVTMGVKYVLRTDVMYRRQP